MAFGKWNDGINKESSIAVNFCRARLGNQLSVFSSQYAIWREFGIYNYIDINQWEKLNKVFDLPSPNSEDDSWPFYIWIPGKQFVRSLIASHDTYSASNLSLFLVSYIDHEIVMLILTLLFMYYLTFYKGFASYCIMTMLLQNVRN